jgi:hypothetical protein
MSQALVDDWFGYSQGLDEEAAELSRCLEPAKMVLAGAVRAHVLAAKEAGEVKQAVSRAAMALSSSYALEAMGFRFAADWCIAELRGVVDSSVVDAAAPQVSPHIVGEELLRGWRFSTSDYNRLKAMRPRGGLGEDAHLIRIPFLYVVQVLLLLCGQESSVCQHSRHGNRP